MCSVASHPERIIIELGEDKSLFSGVLVSHSRAGSYYLSQVHEPGPPTSPHPATIMAVFGLRNTTTEKPGFSQIKCVLII